MNPRIKVLIAAIAIAVLAGGYWKLALGAQRGKAADLQASIVHKRQEVAHAQQTLATYRAARDSYRANYATLVRLGKAVPQDDDTQSLLVQLDAAARESGVDFRALELGGSSAPADASTSANAGTTPPPGAVSVGSGGFSAMPYTFAFRGPFSDLSRFFARLQRFVTDNNAKLSVTGRLLRLDSISLKPDTSGFPRLRAEVTASTFLLPATQGLTPAGTTATSGPAKSGSSSAGPAGSSGSGTATPATTTATISGAPR